MTGSDLDELVFWGVFALLIISLWYGDRQRRQDEAKIEALQRQLRHK
jgi:hypothetical protein